MGQKYKKISEFFELIFQLLAATVSLKVVWFYFELPVSLLNSDSVMDTSSLK